VTPFSEIGNWLHGVWFGYFWPSLQGNGPEDLLSYLIIGGGVTLLGRKLLVKWREHHSHLHKKLDHIIIHSKSIPNEVPGLPDHRQPKVP
jgi:hypothetical protein